jgi:hypothetical protein
MRWCALQFISFLGENSMHLYVPALASGLLLAAALATGQAPSDTPIAPAPADPAIARALDTIQPERIEKTIETLVAFHTRSTLSSMNTDLPPGQGINAAAEWLKAEFGRISAQCGGCLEVHTDTFTEQPMDRIPQPTTITNVYAVLRGSDPVQAKRMYLVTGHYDSRNSDTLDTHGEAPGANDDASGVAVSLECARALSKMHFPATLVFVAVAGEEQGLNGSRHLAALAKSEGWQLEGVLNNDIVGGNTTPGETMQRKDRVRVFSEGLPIAATPEQIRHIRAIGGESDSPSRELARAIADTARSYVPSNGRHAFTPYLVFRPDRYLRGGDHTSFNREGFPAVRFTEWREDFNHQHQNVVLPPAGSKDPIMGDLLQFVDFAYIARVARVNAATLATLATAPAEPEHVAFVARRVENDTTLQFEGQPGAQYEVVWRETTAPDWQWAQAVPAQAISGPVTITLPVSKDNVIFGVRAVDAGGHRGIAVVP